MAAHQGTSISERSDGVSSVLCGSEMVVYGGNNRSRVWCFNPEGQTWRTIECGGEVPEARKWHSAVEHKGEMYVFGGEVASGVDDGVYALATSGRDAFMWERVKTVGAVPAARSHHAAVIVDDYMYVLGGKQSATPTQAAHRRLVREGFFDIYRLHIPTCEWEPVAAVASTPARMQHPCLWGHTACVFRHFLLFYGGFRLEGPSVGEEPALPTPDERFHGIADQQPPTAELNDVVYIFNSRKREWTRNTPKTSVCPQPRALHNAFSFGSEMVIFGGLCVDTANRTVPINDCWRWDIATGQWTYVQFCLRNWQSARLMHCVAQGALYVVHDLSSCYRLGLRSKGDWASLPCDMSGLADVIVAADSSRKHASAARGRRSPGSPARRGGDAEEKQRAALREEMRERLRQELEAESKAARQHEFSMLQKQIGSLKGQVKEIHALQKAQQQQPPTPLPNATDLYPAPLQTSYVPPTTEPPHPWDPVLGTEVSKLVEAVDRLRALGGPTGFQEPGVVGPPGAGGARTLASPMRPPSPVVMQAPALPPGWRMATPVTGKGHHGRPPPTGGTFATHATHGTADVVSTGVSPSPSPYLTTTESHTLSSAGQGWSQVPAYYPPQTPALSPAGARSAPPHTGVEPWQWKILDFAGPSPAGSGVSSATADQTMPVMPTVHAQPHAQAQQLPQGAHIPRVSPPVGAQPVVHAHATAMPPVPHPAPQPLPDPAAPHAEPAVYTSIPCVPAPQPPAAGQWVYQQPSGAMPPPPAPSAPYSAPQPVPLSPVSAAGSTHAVSQATPLSAAGATAHTTTLTGAASGTHGGHVSPTSYMSPQATHPSTLPATHSAGTPLRTLSSALTTRPSPATPPNAGRQLSPARQQHAGAPSPNFDTSLTPAGISLGTDPRTARYTGEGRSAPDMTPLSVAEMSAGRSAGMGGVDALSLADSTPPSVAVGFGRQRRDDHLQALRQQVHDIERAVRVAMGDEG
eukprot:TRINITY_DN29744_c0_g1_i1.p1 TRINITY_DN29744_c0_g1~~TRINITY_DN29744_c0_g1_i1.p1  ORF type:complete len:975 (+),score=196.75 TRINITY_DN29744_c0_g1_i1:96-3020(+)